MAWPLIPGYTVDAADHWALLEGTSSPLDQTQLLKLHCLLYATSTTFCNTFSSRDCPQKSVPGSKRPDNGTVEKAIWRWQKHSRSPYKGNRTNSWRVVNLLLPPFSHKFISRRAIRSANLDGFVEMCAWWIFDVRSVATCSSLRSWHRVETTDDICIINEVIHSSKIKLPWI